MAHKIYENFYLSNEVEDQFNSHLNLQQFCTVDNSLVGTAGMKRKINVYSATNGTEKLTMGEGNTKSIEVSFTDKEYEILLAQNRFDYFDEQEMTDPMLVPVGTRHMGTDKYGKLNDKELIRSIRRTVKRVFQHGGNWNNGSKCGLFAANLNNTSSNSNTNIGSRLLWYSFGKSIIRCEST